MGSGFLMEKGPAEGYVVTNAHVVGLTGTLAQEVECVFFSGMDGERIKPARIVGFDRDATSQSWLSRTRRCRNHST